MAISATINKISLNIANMDRHYYQSHNLIVAQHPSETDLRFMIRLIAFALNASEQLQFTKGLCVDDEPELWVKSLTDEIELWIDFGQVDEKRIRKACGRSKQVIIYTYNEKKSYVWWKQQSKQLERYKNLNVIHLNAVNPEHLLQRKAELQCNIQDEEMILIGSENESVITWNILK
ncbi:MAG: YaeQ family protein [Cocleimonas sp.]